MLSGLLVILIGIIGVAVIANMGRISSDTGNNLTRSGFATQKRSSCITNLRSESAFRSDAVLHAILNRLIILDGRDPETGEELPRITDEFGNRVIDPEIYKELTEKYVSLALEARENSLVYSEKLLQPTLNELCGYPITNKEALDD